MNHESINVGIFNAHLVSIGSVELNNGHIKGISKDADGLYRGWLSPSIELSRTWVEEMQISKTNFTILCSRNEVETAL